MRSRLGLGFLLGQPGRLKAFGLMLLCALWSCGRFGVLLQATSDAGRDPDAGRPYMGCDAASCDEPTAMVCTEPLTVPLQGICGCNLSDQEDSDHDGTPDCIDFCPGRSDLDQDGACACAAAQEDADGDGVANCTDRCPFDPAKREPGVCGCSRRDQDSDADGVPDCSDECPDDQDKSVEGVCGCGQSDLDSDLDGTPDCRDRCSGANDVSYEPITDCGEGYCRQTNAASTCLSGVETACIPGTPLAAVDDTCDDLDDDCDGSTDEDFGITTHVCGQGVCARTGEISCVAGSVVDSCVAGDPRASDDATCDNEDDDCDGLTDENVPSVPSSCGPGACAAEGSIACVFGQLVDSCQASAPIGSTDETCDNVDDDCNGVVDEDFTPSSTSCGTGACARTGMLTCNGGTVVNSCVPAQPAVTVDNSCNNVDDDCDGRIDEQYMTTTTTCGSGICAATGSRRCQSGVVTDSCMPGAPRAGADDPAVPGDGLDNDCDGRVDENLPACDTTPRTYEAGSYTLAIPGNCRRVTVRLWGGGGGGGQAASLGAGGAGGPGGYATASVLVQTPLQLFVGTGASNNCNTGGTNAGSGSYSGGSGGTAEGANGQDGVVSGGGSGGVPSTGRRGGNGHYGGGGGGQGDGGFGASGSGGGGGAASVLLVNGVVAALAGGGGGGGGGKALSILGTLSAAGGKGGSGCRGNGQAPNANGGGGGGGGICVGSSTQAGSDTAPAQSGDIPSGRAVGGGSSCGAGGSGYAIVTFSPS